MRRCRCVALSCNFFVCGYLLQECIAVVGVVHLAAVVLQAVAYDKVINLQRKVVACYLCKDILRYLYACGFVLYYNPRLQQFVVDNSVAAAFCSVECYRNFVAHQCLRVTLVVQKVMHEVLSHPLFGCECDVAFTQDVENLLSSVFFRDP